MTCKEAIMTMSAWRKADHRDIHFWSLGHMDDSGLDWVTTIVYMLLTARSIGQFFGALASVSGKHCNNILPASTESNLAKVAWR